MGRLVLLFALLAAVMAHVSAVTNICYVGYVMDSYCINRGTLFDNKAVESLSKQGPVLHSIHCLVDVAACRVSGYEVLAPAPTGTDFCRAYKLDQAGNDMVIANARAIGMCSTCTGTQMNDYAVTIKGTIPDNPGVLPVLSVTSVESAGAGCPPGTVTVPPAAQLLCESGAAQPWQVAHGSLMLLSWGFLLPTGVVCARYLKHRPGGFWFKIHKPLQIAGLVIAICGWSIALSQFDVFATKQGTGFIHGVVGMLVMTLGILQPINAFFRPHPAEEGKPVSPWRHTWELLHKGSGYTAVLLGLVAILLGTTLVATKTAQGVFLALVGCLVLYLCGLLYYVCHDKAKQEALGAAEHLVSSD